VLVLESAGKASKFSDSCIAREAVTLQAVPLKSDDLHVLALARCSGARLLCTRDDALSQDFTDRRIIKPPGKVYKNASHKHLLKY